MTDDRFVTIREAGEIARVSRRTINNWMSTGKLIIKRTAGGSPRILASSLFRSSAR